MSNIDFDDRKITLSIFCLSYNHEKYLRQTLDSFIMQETNFKFEILVHDDASSDSSPNIIAEYIEKHPNLIKALKRRENVYKKGDLLSIWSFFKENAQGDFIAFCEGDDYWCSKHKLQSQVAALIHENRSDVSFHPTKRIKININSSEELYGKIKEYDSVKPTYIDFESMSDIFIEDTIHISSHVIRRRVFDLFYAFFERHPWLDVGDYFITLLSISGGAIYIDEVMSTYREGAFGSWTHCRKNNYESQISHCIKMLAISKDICALYTYKYNALGARHLWKYAYYLYALLCNTLGERYRDEVYCGLKRKLRKELKSHPAANVMYYGAGSFFDSIITDCDNNEIVSVIEQEKVLKVQSGLVLSSDKLDGYGFKEKDLIVITPLFRGVSIYRTLKEKYVPEHCKFIIIDEYISAEFIEVNIFEKAKEYLIQKSDSSVIENLSLT